MNTVVCDTSGLLAYFDSNEPSHRAAQRAIDAEPGPLVISPLVLAELDHFLTTRYHRHAELTVLDELARGSWQLATFDQTDLQAARAVIAQYSDQEIGLTDASLVVLAERHRTDQILTLDHRHFGVLRTRRGDPFTLLPG